MTDQKWTYPPEFLAALPAFGLAPTPHTPPLLVRDALNDLYRYEIRCLRQRLLNGEFERVDYKVEVVLLRKKYWPLSLQPKHWEIIIAPFAPAPTEGLPSESAE